MYLRDSRALDYLLTRPDWDGKTIVLTGGSMGGQQSLALAGLRPEKISAVLVCVPGRGRHQRRPARPQGRLSELAVGQSRRDEDRALLRHRNFASRIKAPVMAGMGFIDTISPPAGHLDDAQPDPGPG